MGVRLIYESVFWEICMSDDQAYLDRDNLSNLTIEEG